MRLWTLNEAVEDDPPMIANMGLRRWRKFIEAKRWSLSLKTEMAYPGTAERPGSEWHETGCDYYTVRIWRRWKWGEEHFYYDGPHCMFSLGWLHFEWPGDWCEKCMPSETTGA